MKSFGFGGDLLVAVVCAIRVERGDVDLGIAAIDADVALVGCFHEDSLG